MGSTLSRLSEGRFALGLAKGAALRWKAWGLPHPTFEREAGIYRFDAQTLAWRCDSGI